MLKNYTFLKADIVDASEIKSLFDEYKFTDVIHLAAESHVDRSISNPLEFVQNQCNWYCKFVKCCKKVLGWEFR